MYIMCQRCPSLPHLNGQGREAHQAVASCTHPCTDPSLLTQKLRTVPHLYGQGREAHQQARVQ
jgi:hypothetical protein